MDEGTPHRRPTARLIVLDDADRVLLFQVEDYGIVDPLDPRGANRPTICWITPGGGVDEGETYEEAALRELREETGLATERLGPCVHEQEWLLYFSGRPVLLQQRYYPVHASTVAISLDGQNPAERAAHLDQRWWSLAELEATAEAYFPENLPEIVRRALDMR